jgi:hypothetical protein
MRHISSISTGVALGSAGIAMMSLLSGCSSQEEQQQQTQNKFLVIEQQPNGKYKVVEEMPTDGPTRAIIRERDANGNVTERFMNEDEMKAVAQQEYQKVENGTSETVQEGAADTGMGIGGTILAAAAGALMGNMIANSLMNNKAFSRNAAKTNRSAYSRSKSRTSAAKRTSTRKSFFGSSSRRSSSRSFGS